MKNTYHIVATWSGYDVFVTDQLGSHNQMAYEMPHFDAAIRACVAHNGGPVTFEAVSV